jgi:hypothetical protein
VEDRRQQGQNRHRHTVILRRGSRPPVLHHAVQASRRPGPLPSKISPPPPATPAAALVDGADIAASRSDVQLQRVRTAWKRLSGQLLLPE